jgi:phenylpropionate dioxygenase-like ring-hydroxylating dioxygenase large terminal subunit
MAIENFLDLGHFPYVHTGYLGAEHDTEVAPYEVRTDENEVGASTCRFRQPRAAANSEGALEVTYIYRVPHPYCAVLYKINPIARERMDVIALFAQPTGPEETRAHMFVALLDATSSTAALTSFQQEVFAQDKPILENQLPKRLPLDPRAEVSVRADACSVAYRRFLSARGVRYGTLPA